jgi:cardiolipin synthase A/B
VKRPERFVDGNRIDLIESGQDYFEALCSAFSAAVHDIFLESYIFTGDASALRVADALAAAAQRGVAAHLLVDGFGARDMPEVLVTTMRAAGVQILVYRKPVVWRVVSGMRRMHRKLAVADGAVAFAGGINIIDDWNTPHEVPPRFDYAVRIEGPLAAEVRAVARHLWRTTNLAALRPRTNTPPERPRPPAAGTVRAALLVRDNFLHRTEIEDAYLRAIRAAQSRVLIACGYFLPSMHFFRALREAAQRGVDVTVILQGPSDHPLMKAATQSLYRHLLKAGIGIIEYRKSFMHAKVAVIDDHWATVGSSNIDPFSLMLAREANVVIEDQAFAVGLRKSLDVAIAAGGVPVSDDDLRKFSPVTRLLQWLSYRFARVTVDLVAPHGRRRLL